VSRASRIIVLAEDQRHQRFVRYYLYRLGYAQHEIRFETVPNGRGCGEQWVRERCSQAVAECRARNARAATALVVAIDADTRSVNERRNQLPGDRSPNEAIAFLIPKRHIETWVLCLNGETVDEEVDYHLREIDSLIRPGALTLRDWVRSGATTPTYCTESLRIALPELRRIPEA
jgi:hypothetical protein